MKQMKILINGARGRGAMSIQQDEYGVSERGLYPVRGRMAVVSDGIGGLQAGEQFSQLAVREMLAVHAVDDPERDPCERLADAYLSARRKALAFAEASGVEGGATVAAVLVQGDKCAFLSVGDSRIYLLRGGGLIQLNREQTLGHRLDELAALGQTPREAAEQSTYRNSLANNLCEDEDLPWDRCPRPFRVRDGDKLALMTDGIFKALDEDAISRAMALPGGKGALAMARAVKERELPKQDNYTVLVVAVGSNTGSDTEEEGDGN